LVRCRMTKKTKTNYDYLNDVDCCCSRADDNDYSPFDDDVDLAVGSNWPKWLWAMAKQIDDSISSVLVEVEVVGVVEKRMGIVTRLMIGFDMIVVNKSCL